MRYLRLFILPLAVLAWSATSLACPMCKDSIADTAAGNINDPTLQTGLPSGFNSSVYLMLIAVFSMMGLVIGVIARGIRSANVAQKRGFETIPPK